MEEIQELNFSSWAFFLKSGEVTGGFEAQAVFSRSCMAFCCVSFSVDTHCVHNPADTCGTRNKKVTLDFRPHTRVRTCLFQQSLTCT